MRECKQSHARFSLPIRPTLQQVAGVPWLGPLLIDFINLDRCRPAGRASGRRCRPTTLAADQVSALASPRNHFALRSATLSLLSCLRGVCAQARAVFPPTRRRVHFNVRLELNCVCKKCWHTKNTNEQVADRRNCVDVMRFSISIGARGSIALLCRPAAAAAAATAPAKPQRRCPVPSTQLYWTAMAAIIIIIRLKGNWD